MKISSFNSKDIYISYYKWYILYVNLKEKEIGVYDDLFGSTHTF